MHQISWFAHARRLEFTWVIWYQLRRRLCQVIIANRIKNYFTYTNAESTIDRDSEKKCYSEEHRDYLIGILVDDRINWSFEIITTLRWSSGAYASL